MAHQRNGGSVHSAPMVLGERHMQPFWVAVQEMVRSIIARVGVSDLEFWGGSLHAGSAQLAVMLVDRPRPAVFGGGAPHAAGSLRTPGRTHCALLLSSGHADRAGHRAVILAHGEFVDGEPTGAHPPGA